MRYLNLTILNKYQQNNIFSKQKNPRLVSYESRIFSVCSYEPFIFVIIQLYQNHPKWCEVMLCYMK